jgi:ParB-like chromosome segregation protein Spo0J
MTAEPKYQLLDPLTEQQYADLKEDIAERGILTPVIVDEFGEVIDGHHRRQIAEELGTDYPTHQLQPGLSESDKLDASLALNLMGRKQTGPEKRETIKRYLLRRSEASNRHVARLVGCSDNTVASVRTELEAGAQIAHHDSRVGADGISQPARKPSKSKTVPPDPEAVAKRQADLEAKRAKQEAKAAPQRAEQQEEETRWRADIEARGGSLREVSRPPVRVLATQDRIKAAMNDCALALTRALQDPGLDVDLMRAEQNVSKDYRITAVHSRLQKLITEFGTTLKGLDRQRIDAEKASRMVRESPVREQ